MRRVKNPKVKLTLNSTAKLDEETFKAYIKANKWTSKAQIYLYNSQKERLKLNYSNYIKLHKNLFKGKYGKDFYSFRYRRRNFFILKLKRFMKIDIIVAILGLIGLMLIYFGLSNKKTYHKKRRRRR